MAKVLDKRYLKNVSEMPCCCCGFEYGVVAHHLLRGVFRGMGRKANDCYVIPLCVDHHDGLHRNGNEEKYLAQFGVNGLELAIRLYKEYLQR